MALNITRGFRAILDRITKTDQVMSSMITPSDLAREGRYAQRPYAEMVQRYLKWVKVATSRNAAAVANTPLRVVRVVEDGNRKSIIKTRAIGQKRLAHMRRSWGVEARKSLGDETMVEEITDEMHPLVALLKSPNSVNGMFDLLELTQMSLELTGNAYWAVVFGARGIPSQVWQLSAQHVRIVPNRNNLVDHYVYGRGTEVEKSYGPESIIHFKMPNPTGDPFYGLAPLAGCIGDADLSVAFTEFSKAYLENGGSPSRIITMKNASPEQAREAEQRINAKYSGVGKAGRVWVFIGDVEEKSGQQGSIEKPFLQSEGIVREMIAGCFDIPPAMLTLDSSALATAAVAIDQWKRMGISPRCKRLEDRLNSTIVQVFRDSFGDPTLSVVFDNPVEDDLASDTARAVSLYSAGLVTRSVAQAIADVDVDEGDGDGYKQEGFGPEDQQDATQETAADTATQPDAPVTVTPAKTDVQATAMNGAQVAALQSMIIDVGERRMPLSAVRPMMRAAFPLVPTDVIDEIVSSLTGFEPSAPQDQTPQPNADLGAKDGDIPPSPQPPSGTPPTPQKTLRYLHYWQAGHNHKGLQLGPVPGKIDERVREILDAALAYIASALNENASASIPSILERFGFKNKLIAALSAHLGELYEVGYNSGVTTIADGTGVGMDMFDRQNTFAVEALDSYTIKLSNTIEASTVERVQEAVRTGIVSGQTVRGIGELVAEELKGDTPYVAERIARTESARAYMKGRETAFNQSGVVKAKQWILSSDPCPICVAVSEQFNESEIGTPFIPLGGSVTLADGGAYVFDFDDLSGPPAHPYCRCNMGAIFDEAQLDAD